MPSSRESWHVPLLVCWWFPVLCYISGINGSFEGYRDSLPSQRWNPQNERIKAGLSGSPTWQSPADCAVIKSKLAVHPSYSKSGFVWKYCHTVSRGRFFCFKEKTPGCYAFPFYLIVREVYAQQELLQMAKNHLPFFSLQSRHMAPYSSICQTWSGKRFFREKKKNAMQCPSLSM